MTVLGKARKTKNPATLGNYTPPAEETKISERQKIIIHLISCTDQPVASITHLAAEVLLVENVLIQHKEAKISFEQLTKEVRKDVEDLAKAGIINGKQYLF